VGILLLCRALWDTRAPGPKRARHDVLAPGEGGGHERAFDVCTCMGTGVVSALLEEVVSAFRWVRRPPANMCGKW